jgi:hypothetical protein
MVPIWYSYEPGGEVRIITGRTSRKGKLLERAGRFSLCVQTKTPPYKYASVEGSILAVEAADLERHRRPLARRFRHRLGDRYIESTVRHGQERACSYAARTMAHRRVRKAVPVTMNGKPANHLLHLTAGLACARSAARECERWAGVSPDKDVCFATRRGWRGANQKRNVS